jgi:hypothetical protein
LDEGNAHQELFPQTTIEHDAQQHPSFVHYSYGLDEYQKYNVSGGVLVAAGSPTNMKGTRCTESHSTAFFSFSGTIKVHITIKKGAKHISL